MVVLALSAGFPVKLNLHAAGGFYGSVDIGKARSNVLNGKRCRKREIHVLGEPVSFEPAHPQCRAALERQALAQGVQCETVQEPRQDVIAFDDGFGNSLPTVGREIVGDQGYVFVGGSSAIPHGVKFLWRHVKLQAPPRQVLALTGHQRIQALVRVGQLGTQFVERVGVRQPI